MWFSSINTKTLATPKQIEIALSQGIRVFDLISTSHQPILATHRPSHMQLKMHLECVTAGTPKTNKKGRIEAPWSLRMNEVEDMNGNTRNRITLVWPKKKKSWRKKYRLNVLVIGSLAEFSMSIVYWAPALLCEYPRFVAVSHKFHLQRLRLASCPGLFRNLAMPNVWLLSKVNTQFK